MTAAKLRTLGAFVGLAGVATLWYAGGFLLALGVFLVGWGLNLESMSRLNQALNSALIRQAIDAEIRRATAAYAGGSS